MKIVISVNTSWNLINFRAGLIKALITAGYEVVAVAPIDRYSKGLENIGCRHVPIKIANHATNPLSDIFLLIEYYKVMRQEMPCVFLGFTIKPNIFGSLAARLLGVPTINNIAGLGSAFQNNGFLRRIVCMLYRQSLKRSAKVFFQNRDDCDQFVLLGLVDLSKVDVLPGSGINITRFTPKKLPNQNRKRFLFVGRLLWEKGVGEFVEAARLLRGRGVSVEMCLLGFLDVENPSAVSRRDVEQWVAEGIIEYLGVSDDVRKEIGEADCVVLPSFYREGTPRALLEAAAIGRPIITTDWIGCRDVVKDGVNGFLCKPRDASDLVEKIIRMVEMSPHERECMGIAGRKMVEVDYNEINVIKKYLAVIQESVVAGCFVNKSI